MPLSSIEDDSSVEALSDEELLDLVWVFIRRFYMSTRNGSRVFNAAAVRDHVIATAQEFFSRYSDLDVYDCTTSWQDGTAFCALVAAYDSSLLNFRMIDRSRVQLNLSRALSCAERGLGVPQLLVAENVMYGVDENAIITYLCAFFDLAKTNEARMNERLAELKRELAEKDEEGERLDEALGRASTRIRQLTQAQGSLRETIVAESRKLEAMLLEREIADEKRQLLLTDLERTRAERAAKQAAVEKEEAAHRAAAAKLTARNHVIETQLSALQKDRVAVERQLEGLIRMHAFSRKAKNEQPTNSIAAPTGWLCLMFTDVENSTNLWEYDVEAMELALPIHNEIIRQCISAHAGYEVKTEGDAFMVAFNSCQSAVTCALAVQQELLDADWPAKMLDDNPYCKTEYDAEGNLIFRGFRVRMGLHAGIPKHKPDPVTGEWVGVLVFVFVVVGVVSAVLIVLFVLF